MRLPRGGGPLRAGFRPATQADAAALLPRQVGPHVLEPRQAVLDQRLDLQPRSGVRARVAKMSRISSLRSRTLTPRAFSRLRAWPGDRSLSKTTTSAAAASTSSPSSLTLPEPM